MFFSNEEATWGQREQSALCGAVEGSGIETRVRRGEEERAWAEPTEWAERTADLLQEHDGARTGHHVRTHSQGDRDSE